MARLPTKAKVVMDTRPLQKFAASVRGTNAPELQSMFRAWGTVYLNDMQRRYRKQASGGGDWKALAPETIKRKTSKTPRKGHKGPRSTNILIDTGLLMGALTAGGKGSHIELIPGGVKVGVSTAMHDTVSGLSFAQLLMIHHDGKGKNPKRPILVPPSEAGVSAINRITKAAIAAIARRVDGRRM